MSDLLPVSVIIPTRNCRDELIEHLKMMHPVFEKAAQVIGVDGSSHDGTAEVLREFTESRPNAKFLSLPPGLYEGWNAAVSEAQQPWVYFSTIGDWTTYAGLDRLLREAEEYLADVVVSPPRMVQGKNRQSVQIRWPIHFLLEGRDELSAVLLKQSEAILWATSFLPSSFLGSSASNLYRTQLMQQYPFPVDFERAGDTAWTIEVCSFSKFLMLRDTIADFMVDNSASGSRATAKFELLQSLQEFARRKLFKSNLGGGEWMSVWMNAVFESQCIPWRWLSSQDELAAKYHELIQINQQMEKEIQSRLPERIFQMIQRRFNKK
jgi:hypothetical protein